MAAATVALPTTASLSHLCDDPAYKDEVPYEIWANNVPENVPRTNVKLEVIPGCKLVDIRSLDQDKKPTLDTCGAQWIHQEFPWDAGLVDASAADLPPRQRNEVLEKYVEAMSGFLKEKLGASDCICWDWRLRRSKMAEPQERPAIYTLDIESDARSNKIDSAQVIHADGSPAWMQKVVAQMTAADEARFPKDIKYRTRVVTVWRPLVDIVETDPLICCDTRTVDESDLDVVQKVLDDALEESLYLKRRERHVWYWMSAQTRNDVLVMLVWDSDHPETKTVSVPHVSMRLPEHAPGAKPRESVELRFVVWNE